MGPLLIGVHRPSSDHHQRTRSTSQLNWVRYTKTSEKQPKPFNCVPAVCWGYVTLSTERDDRTDKESRNIGQDNLQLFVFL